MARKSSIWVTLVYDCLPFRFQIIPLLLNYDLSFYGAQRAIRISRQPTSCSGTPTSVCIVTPQLRAITITGVSLASASTSIDRLLLQEPKQDINPLVTTRIRAQAWYVINSPVLPKDLLRSKPGVQTALVRRAAATRYQNTGTTVADCIGPLCDRPCRRNLMDGARETAGFWVQCCFRGAVTACSGGI